MKLRLPRSLEERLGLTLAGLTNYHSAALREGLTAGYGGQLHRHITPPSVGRNGSSRKGTAHLPQSM
jgi:hypothetical protein